MEHLEQELDRLLNALPDAEEIRSRLDTLVSVYPFNEYEYLISHLLAKRALSLDQYLELRDNFRKRNRYRSLFELGPTAFGTTWAEEHIRKLVPEIRKATQTGHDLWLDNIRIELKASRAVDKQSKKPLVQKALLSTSHSPFVMNFQQTKAVHFDVMVWIGVWLDEIRYWVQSSREIESNKYYSKGQHRGNKGEGQLHVKPENIRAFDVFQIQPNKLAEAIRQAYQRQIAG